MIDYIPSDVPQVVIEYVNREFTQTNKQQIKYFMPWYDKELYITYPINASNKRTLTGYPYTVIYDCKEARSPKFEEVNEIHTLMHTYLKAKYKNQPHLCGEK